jgi:hypothetical protein
MDLLSALVAPLLALGGVWLGAWITSRSQERQQDREERHHAREALRSAVTTYLIAARQFDQYVKHPATKIKAVPHTAGSHAILRFDIDGEPYRLALESASAGILFVAVSADTVSCAGDLRVSLMRLAEERALRRGGIIPDEPVVEVLKAESAFVESARRDLGVPSVKGTVRTMRLALC